MSAQPVKSREKKQAVPLSRLPRLVISRRWWWTTLLVIAGMLVMARLGIWQLDRLEQRRARNAAYLQQISASPIDLNSAELPADPVEWRDRPATVTGRYDFTRQIILTQQSYQGAPGVHLVTPLKIEGIDRAVLVDRGWVSATDLANQGLAHFDEPENQQVNGAIQLSQTLSGGRESVVEGPQGEWYRIDVEAIQNQLPYQLIPVYLLQAPPEGVQSQPPIRLEPDIELSDGPHLGYAIQWFLFATILALGYLRFISTHSD